MSAARWSEHAVSRNTVHVIFNNSVENPVEKDLS
jgi:hypothetical protein